MPTRSMENKYYSMVRDHYNEPDERHLMMAEELGRELVRMDVPPEEIGELHHKSLTRLAEEFPEETQADFHFITSALLQELLIAFGMAFREKVALLERSNKALEESKERLGKIMKHAASGIIIIGEEGRILSFNKMAEHIFGYTEAAAVAENFSNMILEEGEGSVSLDACSKACNPPKENRPIEMAGRRKDGSIIPLEVAYSELQLDGESRVIAIVKDMTERKHIEAQLIQASKLASLGEMATSIAHELNQPLSIIRMAAECSLESLAGKNAPSDFLSCKLDRIISQVDRAGAIIDHLRIFGRDSPRKTVKVDLMAAARGAAGLVDEQMRLHLIELSLELPKTCRKVMGHQIQLEQVILNLLSNARNVVDAINNCGGEGTRRIFLRIEDDPPADHVKLVVRDTGGGIPENILGRIFEPFFTTKEVGKGTGLGLSISYGIVKEMGGTIEAANVDGGAQFTVTLPVAEEGPALTADLGSEPGDVMDAETSGLLGII